MSAGAPYPVGVDSRRQLDVIAEIVRLADATGVDVWLRGGWAMDFFLGEVTRPHLDIDFFCAASDADRLVAALHEHGYRDDPGPPPEQQRDLVTADGIEVSFALLGRDTDGCPTVAGGPHAGARWPTDLLTWQPCRLGDVTCRIVGPRAQIEIKEMMPVWVPGAPRRDKDAWDVARLRAALLSPRLPAPGMRQAPAPRPATS